MSDHRYELDLTLRDTAGQSSTRSMEFTTAQPNVEQAVMELRQRLCEAAPGKIHAVQDRG